MIAMRIPLQSAEQDVYQLVNMTFETRCTIEVSDIEGMEFECACGTRTYISVAQGIQDSNRFACGNCTKKFFGASSDGVSSKELLTAISDVKTRMSQAREHFLPRFRLVISNPNGSTPSLATP